MAQELIVSDTHPHAFNPPFQSVLLTACRPSWEEWKQSIYQIILALAMYLAPMVLMILTYTHIALVLWMQEIPGDSIQGNVMVVVCGGFVVVVVCTKLKCFTDDSF